MERPRSRLHLVNLILYARMLGRDGTKSTAARQAAEAGGADMLWSFQRTGAVVNLPARCEIGGMEVRVDDAIIHANLEEAYSRRTSLTPEQRDIMTGAFNILHEACAARGITVVHTFIATTPDWYTSEVSGLAQASADAKGCRVLITGMVPAESGAGESIRNRNSAGHFNAAFSRFWAQRMAHILFSEKIVTE